MHEKNKIMILGSLFCDNGMGLTCQRSYNRSNIFLEGDFLTHSRNIEFRRRTVLSRPARLVDYLRINEDKIAMVECGAIRSRSWIKAPEI